MAYSDRLKDPRWQKKRLEILNRAGFMCENCGAKNKTLHVHHGYYERGLDPWEYADDTLWCLCEECHEKAESVRRDVYLSLARMNPCRLVPTIVLPHYSAADIDRLRALNPRCAEAAVEQRFRDRDQIAASATVNPSEPVAALASSASIGRLIKEKTQARELREARFAKHGALSTFDMIVVDLAYREELGSTLVRSVLRSSGKSQDQLDAAVSALRTSIGCDSIP